MDRQVNRQINKYIDIDRVVGYIDRQINRSLGR